MKTCKSFDDLWEKFGSQEEFATDKNILKFTIELNRLFEKIGISKKEFADRIGSSKAYVTRVFKGEANFTIATMTKLVNALEGTVEIHITPKEERNAKWFKVLGNTKKSHVETAKSWHCNNMETIIERPADDYQEALAG